jgi:hypothetical protein
VNLRAFVTLAVFVCVQRDVLATSCARLPPCASVHPGSVLFLGTVVDPGAESGSERALKRDARVSVQEIFEGLPAATKEVVVTTEGWRLEPGQQYLFDTAKGADGHLYPAICGNTAEINYPPISEVVDYLRQRVRGKATTSLTVNVTDNYKPVPDADVTISGPEGKLTRRTNSNGSALFSSVPSAKYGVAAQKQHYHSAEDSDVEVDAVAGTCSSARVSLQSEAKIAGVVRDAKGIPVDSLELELISTPEHPADELSLDQPFFETKTNVDGSFSFESVSPGHYLLGSNIIGLGTSPIPPTFYPGRNTREAAVPIEAKLGETTGNLVFDLPSFGPEREIQLCVVDEVGNAVPAAEISESSTEAGTARLFGERLRTNDRGCVEARGYARAIYAVHAMVHPPGADIRQTRVSDTVVIPPGNDSLHKILKLGLPLGTLLPKRQ